MYHVNVKIGAVGDPPLFPEYRDAAEAELVAVAILEKGMQSGNASAGLFFKSDKGEIFVAQISASMLHTLGCGARGAKERFGDKDL